MRRQFLPAAISVSAAVLLGLLPLSHLGHADDTGVPPHLRRGVSAQQPGLARPDKEREANRTDRTSASDNWTPASGQPHETPVRPPASFGEKLKERVTSPPSTITRGRFTSVQVNVDEFGQNIVGDAANEPSIAVDPTNPDQIAIVWRQFDTIESDFRQAGHAYSHDGGQTWTFPGVLDPGVFRSDPVLAADAEGNFYFNSLTIDWTDGSFLCHVFKSTDGGVTWSDPVWAAGGDKEWMAIDRTDGIGAGNIYAFWTAGHSCCPPGNFTRSADGGQTFEWPIAIPDPNVRLGAMDVGPQGELYAAGFRGDIGCGPGICGLDAHAIAKSTNAQNPSATVTFDFVRIVDLGGGFDPPSGNPNPWGLLGQTWVATDHSFGPTHGNVYILGSVTPLVGDPLDVNFIRSVNGGLSFTEPLRVNDDPPAINAWQWFGTISVAPNGRIDVIWNDTRVDATPEDPTFSEVYYSFSLDGGDSWFPSEPITPPFNHFLGYPQQDNKLGDYYHMVSENGGAKLAYAATFNGEQDVYFVWVTPDCNGNGIADETDIIDQTSDDCNENWIPDECEPGEDCNDNGIQDICDVASGTSEDCNSDHVPDECTYEDCNNNGIQDECETAQGTAEDCNYNEVPDECELAGNDCNTNTVPDDCDILWGTSDDCQSNSIPDECDVAGGASLDCNENLAPDECEPDCNFNGVPDDCDVLAGTSPDCNNNLEPDECELFENDCNENGVPDECDVPSGFSPDCNSNLIPDECELFENDCNENGVPDECDVPSGFSPDCNDNLFPDECEPDCNDSGIPDDCDVASGASPDCNGNIQPDECDIASGISLDLDGDGIPDECTCPSGLPFQEVTAFDLYQAAYFGGSIAISENHVIVGAPRDDDFGPWTGSAWVYHRDDSGTPEDVTDDQWLFQAKLLASDAQGDEQFGYSVCVKNDLIVVGARTAVSPEAPEGGGAVYVFQLDDAGTPTDPNDDSWVEVAKFWPADIYDGRQFGARTACSEDWIVVGASLMGAAYVYRRVNNGTPADPWDDAWVVHAKLERDMRRFGSAVDMSEQYLIVGSWATLEDGGAASVYRRDDGGTDDDLSDDQWVLTGSLQGSNPDRRHYPVSIDGLYAVVGAGSYASGVTVFRRDYAGTPSDPSDDTWVEEATLIPSGSPPDDLYGYSMSIRGRSVVFSAPLNDEYGTDSGAVYVFQRKDNGTPCDPIDDTWIQLEKFVVPIDYTGDPGDNHVFVDFHGDWVAVGAPHDWNREPPGQAFVYGAPEDCDESWVSDRCEAESGQGRHGNCPDQIDDCNKNTVPDECELDGGNDCNENGVPDECEGQLAPLVAEQPIGRNLCVGDSVTLSVTVLGYEPLTYQWRKDGIEIIGATEDSYSIGPVDLLDTGDYDVLIGNICAVIASDVARVSVFDLPTPSPPQPDPLLTDVGSGTKNRYLSFVAGDAGRYQAVAVTFAALPWYEYAEGRTMWVQEPLAVTEASGSNGPEPAPTFWAAGLGCTPFYTDWSTYGTVDVFNDGIVPRGTFELSVIDEPCDVVNPQSYSDGLHVVMAAVGDVVGDCTVCPCTSPQGVVDFVDISAVVEKFKNTPCDPGESPGVPRKARADVINATVSLPKPDQKIDFLDISCVVEAFRGTPCLLPGPPMTDPCQ